MGAKYYKKLISLEPKLRVGGICKYGQNAISTNLFQTKMRPFFNGVDLTWICTLLVLYGWASSQKREPLESVRFRIESP